MRGSKLWLASLVLLLVAGCSSSSSTGLKTATTSRTSKGYESASPGDPDLASRSKCGYVRWPQKTGTDAQASQVNQTPKATTIAALTGIKSPLKPAGKYPPHSVARSAPVEVSTYTIRATLTGYALEADSDLHLVITDGTRTMIVEIPNPTCVAGGPFKTKITSTRAAFLAKYPHPPLYPAPFAKVHSLVTVTGVGFFDYIHGQTGVAKNGAELHPLLSIMVG